jgi:hypothetical protein
VTWRPDPDCALTAVLLYSPSFHCPSDSPRPFQIIRDTSSHCTVDLDHISVTVIHPVKIIGSRRTDMFGPQHRELIKVCLVHPAPEGGSVLRGSRLRCGHSSRPPIIEHPAVIVIEGTMYKASNRVRFGYARTLVLAIVLDTVNQSMARYPSGSRGVAVMWLCVDVMLFIAVARGSRAAWRILGASMAFGAALFLIAGLGDPSGFQLPRGLLFAAQLLLLFSPAVRIRVGIRGERLEARAG